MLRMKVSETFHKDVMKALKKTEPQKEGANVVNGGGVGSTNATGSEHVCAGTSTGYFVFKDYIWMSTSDFEREHSVKASEMGLCVETITNEKGVEETGVIFQDPSTPRKIRLFSRSDLRMDDIVHDAVGQLRPNQGRDAYSWYFKDAAKNRPKPLRPSSTAPPDLQTVRDDVKRRREEIEAELQKLAQMRDAQPSSQPAAQPVKTEEEEAPEDAAEEEEEEDEEEPGKVLLPSERVQREKASKKQPKKRDHKEAQRKWKGKAKTKAKATASVEKKLKAPSGFLGLGHDPASEVKAEHSGSCASSEGGGKESAIGIATVFGTSTEHAEQETCSVKRHFKALNLTKILRGHLLRDKLYHATRHVETLKREGDTSATLLLQGHIDMVKLAMDREGLAGMGMEVTRESSRETEER